MSLFMPKQNQHHHHNNNHQLSLNSCRTESTNRIQHFNIIMSSEETKQLAGLVAKNRALFENTNTNRYDSNHHNHNTEQKVTIKQKSNFIINRPTRTMTTFTQNNENDSDKENSSFKKQDTIAPFLNQLKPTTKLASKFQTIFNQNNTSNTNNNNNNNVHLSTLTPTSQLISKLTNNNKWLINNQQYKSETPLYSSSSCSASSSSSSSSSPPPSSLSCHSFESSNDINDCANMVSNSNSPSGLWQPSEEFSKEYNLPTSVRQAKMCFERSVQHQQKSTRTILTTPNKIKLNESPIFSSSSSSTSSVPSSPTSSLDNSTRFKTILTKQENKYIYPAYNHQSKPDEQIHLPSLTQTPQVNTSNNKIKILKKNFSKQNNQYMTTNDETKEDVGNHENGSSNQQNETSTASIKIKTFKIKQPEPIVTIKSILRNKTPVEQQQQQKQEDLLPILNEKYVERFLEKTSTTITTDNNQTTVKVDQSSCVLPSKMKSKNTISNDQPTVVKTINNFKSIQPNTNSFVKNNPFTINNTNNSSSQQNGFKRVNKSAATAKENLLKWCRKYTESYSNISIDNFSSSWSNGLAFCALINNFIPDAFDYDSLEPINARRNFELAFKTAEERAGIVSLLDVDDMIEMGNSPDWKCVFTYVHSIYQKFKETQTATTTIS